MQNAGDYYQRAPRCCPGRNANSNSGNNNNNSASSGGGGGAVRGAELLCCCCSCSTATSTKTPGLLASLGVCVLVLGYTLLGAFAFMALEGDLKSDSLSEIAASKPDGVSYVLPNLENDSTAMELRARTVEKLWSITEDLNVLYKENWTRLAAREVLEFQENLARGLRRTSYEQTPPLSPRSREHHADSRRLHGRRWTFSSSLLYSLTLITTIGYGSVAPRTVWGRLITIVYALAGIPLMLVYLSTVGDVLARSFRRLYGRVCRRPRNCARKQQPPPPPPPVGGIMTKPYRYDNHVETKGGGGCNYYSASRESSCDDLGIRSTGSAILLDCGSEGLLHATTSSTAALQDVTTGNGKRHFHPCSLSLSSTSSPAYMLESNPVRIPISLCLAIMLVYICGGAVMFNRLEGWSLLEGGYFCFTSLGTIGFGDLMPVGRNAPTTTLEELSLCACSLYILAGMGLIAMCFNLVQEEVVRVVRVFGRTCGMSSGVVVGPIGGTGAAISGLKVDLDDGGGTSDSRLSEQEEEAIAMSMVPAAGS
ncbi:potassium channel subfamily K member 18 isoform X2 [Solenopsis invicta]|uniref:potassium channel subfamily K member 18 isoform X2 n=1 Tax=Solenopsis invicta TaxID=13686 RepID=UPI000E33DD22|nr:potassium channel subfamily K member 18 isoform X2 [Solenopsis invicta]